MNKHLLVLFFLTMPAWGLLLVVFAAIFGTTKYIRAVVGTILFGFVGRKRYDKMLDNKYTRALAGFLF